MALFVLNFLLKSGQMVGSWVAKPISIWRGKLVGWAGFASWPRFASCSRFTSYSRFTRFASCSRFTSYSRFTRLASYTSPTSSARSSAGAAIFSFFPVNKFDS